MASNTPKTNATNNQTALAGQANENNSMNFNPNNKTRHIMSRNEIADEMLKCCSDDVALGAHQAAAEAIRRGDDLEGILGVMSFDVYPETYVWVLFMLG